MDLPGYGYAKASEAERAKWGKMIEKYLNKRENLVMVVLLVDIRHAPSKDDVLMYEWISNSGLNTFVVATKLDKIKRSQIDKQKKLIRDTLGMKSGDKVYTFSSLSKAGREELLECMSTTMGLVP